jgi:6-phosphofructokinase 1
VISSATIEAINSGYEVIGIYDGYEHLMKGDLKQVRRLEIQEVSRIHSQGGSILRTARANPRSSKQTLTNTVLSLHKLGISDLITIGGDDTAFGASEVAREAQGTVRVVHVPKTIDNDLPLPGHVPTFGYETARHVGTEIVRNLMEDSRTTNRWYFVVIMGRKAGHLALGVGKAAGATLTMIPEEYPSGTVTMDGLCDAIEGSIIKRKAAGQKSGLAVFAEGVAELFDPAELKSFPGVEITYDPYGNPSLSDLPLARILKTIVQERFAQRGDNMAIIEKTIGYELRSAPPIPFDIDYTRTLGYGAVRKLAMDWESDLPQQGGMVYYNGERLATLPFSELRDPETGRTRIRMVDIQSESYKVAREYMIRLERGDFEDAEQKARLAEAAGMTVEEFEARFSGLAESG